MNSFLWHFRVLVAPLPLARARLAHLSALAAVSMAAPLVGRQVTISGLNSRPELNGKQGLAIAFHDDKGRYNVRLQSNETILLKPSNLTAADSGGGGSGGGGMPGFGGGGMPGFGGGGMPGFGGAGMPGMGAGGAQAAALQALLAQLKQKLNLPPGVTPGHLGIALVAVLFVMPRVLGIGMLQSMLLGGAGAFIFVSAQSSEGGVSGVLSAGRRAVGQVGAALTRATGRPVTEKQAMVFVFGMLFLLWKFVLGSSSPSSGGGFFGFGGDEHDQQKQGYAAYSKGYRDGQKGKPYDPIADFAAPTSDKGGGGGFGIGKLFSLAMVGSMVYQMGCPGGQPFSMANVVANARNANPMQLVMMLSMASSLFS